MQANFYALNKQIITSMILVTNALGLEQNLESVTNKIIEEKKTINHLSLPEENPLIIKRKLRSSHKKSIHRKSAIISEYNYNDQDISLSPSRIDPRRSWRKSCCLKSSENISINSSPVLRKSIDKNPDSGLKRISLSSKLIENTYGLDDLICNFNELKTKVKKNPNADIIDIVMILDSNGKMGAFSLVKFIEKFNNMLVTPEILGCPEGLTLSSVIDTFVGSGSGAISATLAALGSQKLNESAQIVKTIPTEPLRSKTEKIGSKLVGAAKLVEASLLSALNQKSDSSTTDSVITIEIVNYDKFDFKKQKKNNLFNLFQNLMVQDLKSSLELLDAPINENLTTWVESAIKTGDKNKKAKNSKLTMYQAMESTFGIMSSLSKTDDDLESINERIPDDFIDEIKGIETGLSKQKEKDLSATDLINSIVNKDEIKRDIILVNLKAEKIKTQSTVVNLQYDIKKVKKGMRIINMKYKIGIPEYYLKDSNKERSPYWANIEEAIMKIDEKETRIGEATNLLMDFFNVCNKRVVDEIVEVCKEE